MRRLLSIAVLLTAFIASSDPLLAQGQYVKVSGHLYSAADSTPAVANIRYEQLPHRGHSGDFYSTREGAFEFWLAVETDYYIRLQGDGWTEDFDTLSVVGAGESGEMIVDYYILPVEEENFTLHDLIFGRGSDVIRETSYEELNDFVRWLKDRPTTVVQLEGHTDIAGNPDANMRLSEARVTAVKEYLRKKGIDQDRVKTKAFGGTHPLSEERTPEAVAANRRVEVRVIAR